MSKGQKILYSVFGGVAIVVIILLFGIFRSLRNSELNTNESVVKAKDQTISVIMEGRERDRMISAEKDKMIYHLLEADSIREAKYLQNQKVYNKINEKLRSIPAYIDRIGNNGDSLRAAYANFR